MKCLCLFLTFCFLAACGGPANTVPQSFAGQDGRSRAASTVYVAESCALSYQPCAVAQSLIGQLAGRPITDGVTNPVAMAVDKSGNLYVSNAITVDSGNVTVYAAGSGRLMRTLTGFQGASYAMAVSASGVLYVVSHYKVGCCRIQGSVAVYRSGETNPSRFLSGVGAFPGKPAFDASGNLYQPNFYNFPGFINVYAPGATNPSRTIVEGIGFPLAVTVDTHGKLYVLNGVFSGGTDILAYAAGSSSPAMTITAGVSNASAIALGAGDDLFVANRGQAMVPGSVLVYARRSSTPARTIQTGISDPIALAVDASGTLYVANAPQEGTGTVTVYAPGAVTPERTYRLAEAPTALTLFAR